MRRLKPSRGNGRWRKKANDRPPEHMPHWLGMLEVTTWASRLGQWSARSPWPRAPSPHPKVRISCTHRRKESPSRPTVGLGCLASPVKQSRHVARSGERASRKSCSRGGSSQESRRAKRRAKPVHGQPVGAGSRLALKRPPGQEAQRVGQRNARPQEQVHHSRRSGTVLGPGALGRAANFFRSECSP